MNSEQFMNIALAEAIKARNKGEIPVGCIIVKDGKVISKGYNLRESKKNSLYHAEIIAINKACKKLKSWRLLNCEMYVTLEPCSMCAGAIIQSRIKKLYIGTDDPKTGACGSKLNIIEDYKHNHEVEIERNIMQKECQNILQEFFKELRIKKKEK